jgi:hypothetical protein
MRKALFVLVAASLLVGVGAAQAQPTKPPDVVCNGPAGGHNPLCPDGPPGPPGEQPPCSGAVGAHNPNCASCPPATGPVSGGVVQPVSDGIRGGGGGAAADVVDTVNCELIQGTLGA